MKWGGGPRLGCDLTAPLKKENVFNFVGCFESLAPLMGATWNSTILILQRGIHPRHLDFFPTGPDGDLLTFWLSTALYGPTLG